MTFGSRAPYAKRRNEQAMRSIVKQNDDFPNWGPSSMQWMHQKQLLIQRGNGWDLAKYIRIGQENRLRARLNEEKQIAGLTAGRRASLIGEAGRTRAAQRAAEQLFAQ